MNYCIVNGKIETRSLEVHITDHCNLSCRQCCTLSPFLGKWSIDPEQLKSDLRLCQKVLSPRTLKLTGGEPLLHPQLLDCIRIAKDSGISSKVSLTTNGLLLSSVQSEIWDVLDSLTLSVYPSSGFTEERLEQIEEFTLEHDLSLNIKYQDAFQEMTPDKPNSEQATKETFSECWLRHRCHMIRQGYFYLCTRPPHLDQYLDSTTQFAKTDGLRLHDGSELVHGLLAYLTRSEALNACCCCLGSNGEFKPHQLLDKSKQGGNRRTPHE